MNIIIYPIKHIILFTAKTFKKQLISACSFAGRKVLPSKLLLIPLFIFASAVIVPSTLYAELGYDAGLMTEVDHDPSFEAVGGAGVYWSTSTDAGSPVYPYSTRKKYGRGSFTWPTVTTLFSGRYISLVNFITGLTPGNE